ncbi:MAG: M20/M25/M40 family metallo-hydrolase [Acidimicrobiales bacterium]
MPVTLADFERSALPALTEYATIPCLSPGFDPHWDETGHLRRAAELLAQWSRTALPSADVEIRQLPGLTPVLTVTLPARGAAATTAVLYGHLDKQPPLGDWSAGLSPYDPVRRGDRLYARGVADDGYAAFAAVLALAELEATGADHPRCVVLIEASEETGSSDLPEYLDALAPELGPVALLVCLDAGGLSYDRLWLTSSLRGLVNVEVTARVLDQGLHSGLASGVVPSSARILRQLLDRLEDSATGRVVPEQLHVAIPADHRDAATALAAMLGDGLFDEFPVVPGLRLMGDTTAARILAQTWEPALSIIGLGGAPAPDIAGNVLRPSTTAVLSMRLAPPTDPDAAAALLVRLLEQDPPSGAAVRARVTSTGAGWVAPPLAPWLDQALGAAAQATYGAPPAWVGEGGSIPFLNALSVRYPGVQIVSTGVLGPGANAHGIDEMLDLPTVVRVINVVTALLAAAGADGAS